MAQAGEVEVFRITPEVGKCYEHIEATRSVEAKQGPDHRYFSTKQRSYVGKFVKNVKEGSGNGIEHFAIFDDNGKENKIQYSYKGFTCFIEVECKTGGGKRKTGMRKRSRRTRRKLKTRKHRK